MTNTKKRTHTRLYLYGLLACACLTGLLTFSCRNFFHELIPLQENKIESFSVPGQIGQAVVSETTVTFTVSTGVSLTELLPVIRLSEQAMIIPVTPEYFSAAFPCENVFSLLWEMYEVKDLAAWALDVISRNPDFNVPALNMPVDFRNPVPFIVISGAGQVRMYTVSGYIVSDSIDEPVDGQGALRSLTFSKYLNPALTRDAPALINEADKTITVYAVYPVETTGPYELIPSFAAEGASVSIDGTPAVSGESLHTFTSVPALPGEVYGTCKIIGRAPPVSVHVMAPAEGTDVPVETDYELIVCFTEDPDTVRSIVDFRFIKATNQNQGLSISSAVCAITDEGDTGVITAEIPYEGDAPPYSLTPFFVTPGTLEVNGAVQQTGVSVQDFSGEVTYVCTSRNGQFRRTYTVRLSFIRRESVEPRMTDFRFSRFTNPGITADAQGYIDEGAGIIRVNVGYEGGIRPERLVPEFKAAGEVSVQGSIQTSGYSVQEFGRAVTYTVTAPDGERKPYRVEVSFIPDAGSDCELKSFGFSRADNPSLSKDAVGVIEQRNGTVYALLPAGAGSGERELVPSFTAAGTVTLNGVIQESGVSAVNCGVPLTYRVTSANGKYRKEYTVMVQESGGVIYLDTRAAGRNNGATWDDAFISPEAAFEYAKTLDSDIPVEIWIAGDIRVTARSGLSLRPNLTVRGGFTGGEADESERAEGARSGVSGSGTLFSGYDMSGSIVMNSLKCTIEADERTERGIDISYAGSVIGSSFEMDNCEVVGRDATNTLIAVNIIDYGSNTELAVKILGSVFTYLDVVQFMKVSARDVVIEDCRFTGVVRPTDVANYNWAVHINANGGESAVRNCEFNRIQGLGLLYVRGSSNLNMENVRFAECKFYNKLYGEMIRFYPREDAVYTISECTFTSCITGYNIISITGDRNTSVFLVNCLFVLYDDLWKMQSIIEMYRVNTVFISGCTFRGETEIGKVYTAPMIILYECEKVTMIDCLFENCTTYVTSKFLSSDNTSIIDIARCRFENNTMAKHQMYFSIKSGSVRIDSCVFLPVAAGDIGITRGVNPGAGTAEFTFTGQFPPLPMQLYLYDTEGIIIKGIN